MRSVDPVRDVRPLLVGVSREQFGEIPINEMSPLAGAAFVGAAAALLFRLAPARLASRSNLCAMALAAGVLLLCGGVSHAHPRHKRNVLSLAVGCAPNLVECPTVGTEQKAHGAVCSNAWRVAGGEDVTRSSYARPSRRSSSSRSRAPRGRTTRRRRTTALIRTAGAPVPSGCNGSAGGGLAASCVCPARGSLAASGVGTSGDSYISTCWLCSSGAQRATV